MKRTIQSLLFIILLGCAATAAAQNPFTWRANVKMKNATEGEVIIKVGVADGWHLYGISLPKGGPKATVFDLTKSTGVKFVGSMTPSVAPVEKQDKMFNLKLSYWVSNVTFRQRFKVVDKAKAKIIGTVSYMGCNDVTCSAPNTFNFTKNVVVK